jgi:hypothetical protein
MNFRFRIAAVATASALLSPVALSAGPMLTAQQSHQQERAHCMSGKSQQDKNTCLKEAQAAYQESRRNALGSQSSAELSTNAMDRCKSQPASDRASCIDRINGSGSSEGSVKEGGIIRRTETKVP